MKALSPYIIDLSIYNANVYYKNKVGMPCSVTGIVIDNIYMDCITINLYGDVKKIDIPRINIEYINKISYEHKRNS